ncbi:hypothetical protein [Archangium primigenium]|uniref:SitA5 family polymorphic toxin n=1 Tax=[Archangium] primigenium TaxID=2792470 RepID=UPI001EF825C3|nr:hypothetical protein [Archangium primigenium]
MTPSSPWWQGARRFLGTWALLLLTVWSACVPTQPLRRAVPERPTAQEVEEAEPVCGLEEPLPIGPQDFRVALRRLGLDRPLPGSPRETARRWLETPAEHAEPAGGLEGEWLAEVSDGRVLTLLPLDETPLTSEAQLALRRDYAHWCQRQGGGDCLSLLDDGPDLRADDRRTLALALALGGVLEETRGALEHEVTHPRAVVSLLVWTVGLYAMLWLVPEPVTKGLAAALSVLMVAWLGVETLWRLVEGWAVLTRDAHAATRFSQLRGAGRDYARVLGESAARALLLGAAALTGRTLGEVAARVKLLPGAEAATMRWGLQTHPGTAGALDVLATSEALTRAVATVELVAATPGGPLAVVLLRQRGTGPTAPGKGPSVTVDLRHRGGNRQVLLGNGQRWHLPRDTSPEAIPKSDPVGDQLQAAVSRAAKEWGTSQFTDRERRAIAEAQRRGKYWLARLLEREARGRFVEARVYAQFRGRLKWNRQGVDVEDVATGFKYEILSGTPSNLARHGRRMTGEFFRMLTF